MKKYLLISMLLMLLFFSCTGDNNEFQKDTIDSRDLSIVDECTRNIYPLSKDNQELGRLLITNDIYETIVFFKFEAAEGYFISSIRWYSASDLESLPINNGGLIIGKLNIDRYDFANRIINTVPIDNNRLYYTAKVEFIDELGATFSVWVGDIEIGKNKSKYLKYDTCANVADIPCFVGTDKFVTLKNSYVQSQLYGVSLINNYLLSMLDEGVSKDGTLIPSAYSLIQNYKINNFQTFTTKYIISEEDCTDHVYLSITIIP